MKVGASSEDVRQTATFTKAAEETVGAVSKAAYLDPALPVDRRLDDLVSRMTIEEKASQLVNRTRAIARLGVPEYNLWSEALHGVANNGIATVFPQAIGLAATFDAPLVKQMAEATAREARVKWNQATRAGQAGRIFRGLTFYSPNINIFRDPRWGRGQETYGEDPLPHRQARRRVHRGPAGARSRPPDGDRHRQALRRPQRSRAAAPRLRREGLAPRHRGHVPAGLPRRRRRREGQVGDVRLQRDQRRPRLCQRAPARRHAARAVEVRGLRDRRLRRGAGHRDRPQVREVGGRGGRPRDRGRARQRLYDERLRPAGGAARLPALRGRAQAGPADRGGGGRRAQADAANALPARPVRSRRRP